MEKKNLAEIDPEIAEVVRFETIRQNETLEMIASENITSPAIMEVQGSVLTNKYAEGYPGVRYYGGCEQVDVAERLAIERARELFCADYVNVQPHSGSQANMAVYFSLLDPGDTILGMDLACGGHLTHGSRVNFSGRLFNFVHYGVSPDTETIDYEEVERLAGQHRPKMIVAGASAYPRLINFSLFSEIANSVKALLMVDMAHIAGLVATGYHPSPVPHADIITSTTHKTLRGPRGGLILARGEYGERLDKQIFPGIQGGPLMHVIAAKAVAFKEAMTPDFKKYQEQVVKNARLLASVLSENRIRLVAGGTDNHMILADVSGLGLTGRQAEEILGRAGITVNKNAIPYDKKGPKVTSGIRLGTPALTTRGFAEKEIEAVGNWIVEALKNPGDEGVISGIRERVRSLCQAFPLTKREGKIDS